MEQIIVGGYSNALSEAATEYNCLMGGFNWNTTETIVLQIIPTGGTISSLFVELSAAVAGGANTYVFTLMVDGSPTALTCTVTAGNTTASDVDTGHAVAVIAGQTVSIRSTYTGSPGTPTARWSTKFIGTIAGEIICMVHSSSAMNTTAARYVGLQGISNPSATEYLVRTPIPTAGTFKKMYVWLSADPGTSPDAFTYTLRVGGVDKALTCTVVADDTTGNDTEHTVAVSAGDLVDTCITPTSTPTVNHVPAISCVFVANTDGESLILMHSYVGSSTAVANYVQLCNGYSPWNTTEADVYQLLQATTLQKLHVKLNVAPGAGNSYRFDVRTNGTDSGLTVTITGAVATTGNDTVNTATPTEGQTCGMEVTPDSTPDTAGSMSWGLVGFIAVGRAANRRAGWWVIKRGRVG